MATIGKTRARCVGRLGGGEVPTLWLKEGASQSLQDGQFVMMDATRGVLVVGSGAAVAGVAGMAQKDASGVTGAELPVSINLEDCVWEMNLLGASAADYTSNASGNDIGTCYAIIASGNKHYVDSSDTTNERCRVIRFAPGSAAGDVNARVHVVLLASTRNTSSAAKDSLFTSN